MSVKMQLKSTWSTATLDMTLVTNPARRWTFKQVLCQNRRIQNLNYPLCLAKRCQCQERCLLTPRSTLWLNLVATLVSLWASPSCTSSYQSRWFGIKLWFGRWMAKEVFLQSSNTTTNCIRWDQVKNYFSIKCYLIKLFLKVSEGQLKNNIQIKIPIDILYFMQSEKDV